MVVDWENLTAVALVARSVAVKAVMTAVQTVDLLCADGRGEIRKRISEKMMCT